SAKPSSRARNQKAGRRCNTALPCLAKKRGKEPPDDADGEAFALSRQLIPKVSAFYPRPSASSAVVIPVFRFRAVLKINFRIEGARARFEPEGSTACSPGLSEERATPGVISPRARPRQGSQRRGVKSEITSAKTASPR